MILDIIFRYLNEYSVNYIYKYYKYTAKKYFNKKVQKNTLKEI